LKSLFFQEITMLNTYITSKKLATTGAIISKLHYYGHIYMTCLLFFKKKNQKIQDSYSYFEITLKFNNKSPFVFYIFHYIHIFYKQTCIFVKEKEI
jgi:hypothetical protein